MDKDFFSLIGDFLTKYATGHIVLSIIIALIVIVLMIITSAVSKKIRKKMTEKDSESDSQSNISTIKLVSDIIRILLAIIGILAILQVNNINVTSIITGLGIAGAVIGLAIQDPLKDIVSGIQLAADKFFKVGDAVRYKDFEGTVKSFTMRTTKIIDFDNSTVMSVSNRNISEIVLIPDPMYQYIPVPLSYEDDSEQIHKDMQEITQKVKEDELIEDCIYRYTDSFDASSVAYMFRITNSPSNKNIARRNALTIIQRELKKKNYVIPYDQIDVHTK